MSQEAKRDGTQPLKKRLTWGLTWGNFCVHPFQTLLACLWADLPIARWWFWACTYPRCRCLKSCTVGWWEFPQHAQSHKMAGPAEPEPPKRARGRCGDDQFFVSCLEPWFMMLEVTGDVSTHWITQNTKLCALSVASFTQHLHQKPSTWFKCWVWPLFPTWTISFPRVKLSREYYCTTFHQGCKSLVRAEVPEMAVHYHGRVKRPMERAKRLVIHVFDVSLHLHPRLLALKMWIVLSDMTFFCWETELIAIESLRFHLDWVCGSSWVIPKAGHFELL